MVPILHSSLYSCHLQHDFAAPLMKSCNIFSCPEILSSAMRSSLTNRILAVVTQDKFETVLVTHFYSCILPLTMKTYLDKAGGCKTHGAS